VSTLTAAITAALANQQPSPQDGLKERRLKAYWALFDIIAAANKWSPAERAVQMASALEGDARSVLRDVTVVELDDPSALVLALKSRFGDTTPAVVMRQKFNSRIRADGEKLGVFAAELHYLAQKGFPDFDEMTRSILAKEAIIHGLLPIPLRQQVRLMDPNSLEEALERAIAVEDILIEGSDT